MTRHAVQAALDALELGDVRGAEFILLNALEDGAPADTPHRCEGCGRRFEWPGLLEHHRFLCVHLLDQEAAA